MRYEKITINTLLQWHENCATLIDLYKTNNDLPMIAEWAILQNYKSLDSAYRSYQQQKKDLEQKFGSLQSDGSYVLDTTSDVTMQLYEDELKRLNESNVTVRIAKVNHSELVGRQGVTLETMLLLDFMIA